jgi:hypothetical protein
MTGKVDRMTIGTGSTSMGGTVTLATTGMIKGCIPVTGVVTLRTVGAKYPCMQSRFSMTGRAESGRTLPGITDVASVAGKAIVRPGQREGGQVVVKGGERKPSRR